MRALIVALTLLPALANAADPGPAARTYGQRMRDKAVERKAAFSRIVTRAQAAGVNATARLRRANITRNALRVAGAATMAGGAAVGVRLVGWAIEAQNMGFGYGATFAATAVVGVGVGLWYLGNEIVASARGHILQAAERVGVTPSPAEEADFLKSGYARTPR